MNIGENIGNVLIVRVNGGVLRADPSQDPDFPGMDIEFIPDKETDGLSRPRVLIETPKAEEGGFESLRCLVWGRKDSEDYTEEINFE